MRRAVLVISDVHLAALHRGGRLPYRSAAFAPDAELSATLDGAVARARRAGAALEIVLNGDVFDLDAPDEGEAAVALRARDVRQEVGADAALRQTLADHPGFLLALRRAMAAGARVVVLPGNHDAQLALPRLRDTLRGALGTELVFRSWFYRAAGGLVLVEHGHLYDPLCVLTRLRPAGGPLEATVGTVSSFYGPCLFESGDPFVVDPFAERRSVMGGLQGAMASMQRSPLALLACARELLALCPAGRVDEVAPLAAEAGVTEEAAAAHRALAAPKVCAPYAVDAAAGALDYGAEVDIRLRHAMETAATLHGARVAVVGHTHAPERSIRPNGVVLLNAGAWTPRRSPEQPVGTYAWIDADARGVTYADVEAVRSRR